MLLNQKLEYFILVVFINMVPLAFAQETDNTDSIIAQSGSMNAMPILPPMPDPNDCYWAGSGPICIGWCRSDEYIAASSRRGRGIECLAGFQRLCCKIRPIIPTVLSTTPLPSTMAIADNSSAVLPIIPLTQRRSCYWIGEAPTCDSWCQAGEYVAAASRKGIDGNECETGLKKYCCKMLNRRVTPPPINIVIVNNTWSLASFAPTTQAAQTIQTNSGVPNVAVTSPPAKSPADLMASIMASVNPLFEAAMNKSNGPSNSSIPANVSSLVPDFSSTPLPETASEIPIMALSTMMPFDMSNMSSASLPTIPPSTMLPSTLTTLSSSSLPLISTGEDSMMPSPPPTEMLTASNVDSVSQSSTTQHPLTSETLPLSTPLFSTSLQPLTLSFSTTPIPVNLTTTQPLITSPITEGSTSTMPPTTLISPTTSTLLISPVITSTTVTTTVQPPDSSTMALVSTPQPTSEIATSTLTPEIPITTTEIPLVPVTLQTATSTSTVSLMTTFSTTELPLSTLSTATTSSSSTVLPLMMGNVTSVTTATQTSSATSSLTNPSTASILTPSLETANIFQTVTNPPALNNSTPVTATEVPTTMVSSSTSPLTTTSSPTAPAATQSTNMKPIIILASKIQTRNDSLNLVPSNSTLIAPEADTNSNLQMSNTPIIIPNYLKRNCKKNTSTTPSPSSTVQMGTSEISNNPAMVNFSRDENVTGTRVTLSSLINNSSAITSIPFDGPN